MNCCRKQYATDSDRRRLSAAVLMRKKYFARKNSPKLSIRTAMLATEHLQDPSLIGALAHRLAEANSGTRLHFGTSALNQFHSQEHSMNKDQAKGRIEEAKAKIKEVAGNVSVTTIWNEKERLKNPAVKLRQLAEI